MAIESRLRTLKLRGKIQGKRQPSLDEIVGSEAVRSAIARIIEHQGRGGSGVSESERERLTREAEKSVQNYFLGMRANIKHPAWFFGRLLAQFSVWAAFSEVNVTAPQKTIDTLRRGNAAVYSSHFAFDDIGILPVVFERHGIKSVYYFGGENLYDVGIEVENRQPRRANYRAYAIGSAVNYLVNNLANPAFGHIKSAASYVLKKTINPAAKGALSYLLRNSGFVSIKRGKGIQGEGSRENALLFKATSPTYARELCENRNVIVNFAGRGRHHGGKIENVDASATKGILEAEAEAITVTITYDTPPEDTLFANSLNGQKSLKASAKAKRKSASVLQAIWLAAKKYPRLIFPFVETYGAVHVVFSDPMPARDYFSGTKPTDAEVGKFHEYLTQRIIQNVTLTPKSAVALAIDTLGSERLTVPSLEKEVDHLVKTARSTNMHISEKLTGPASYVHVTKAIDYFAARKAFEVSTVGVVKITNPALLTYYANTVAKTFSQHIQQGVH
ncbi:hypothetical protein HYU40_03810 [Candidatus Woesearchaeota archaeon]|nr:hypothetical protein [Candidatus Woesearchaeota archaeon]